MVSLRKSFSFSFYMLFNIYIYIYTRFLIYEKTKASIEEKQVFISTYLQDLHIYLSVTIGLRVPGLSLVILMILNFVELSNNLFSTNKALRRCYTTAIEISQSIVYALTYNITCQSAFLLRMRN